MLNEMALVVAGAVPVVGHSVIKYVESRTRGWCATQKGELVFITTYSPFKQTSFRNINCCELYTRHFRCPYKPRRQRQNHLSSRAQKCSDQSAAIKEVIHYNSFPIIKQK